MRRCNLLIGSIRISRRSIFAMSCSPLLAVTAAFGDSITIGDTRYDDVYVTESSSLYYASLPETGETLSIAKDDPALGSVEISPDPDLRDEIYSRYQETRARLASSKTRETGATNLIASSVTSGDLDALRWSSRSEHRGTPLLMLRGERPVYTSVATPARANGAPSAANPQVGGGPGRSGAGAVGSMGASGGRGGATASGEGSGGRGRAGGGRGGGQTGTGAGFTNISELFATIDDAEVGETPNPITGG